MTQLCCALRIMGRKKSKFKLTKFVDFALRTTEISQFDRLCAAAAAAHMGRQHYSDTFEMTYLHCLLQLQTRRTM